MNARFLVFAFCLFALNLSAQEEMPQTTSQPREDLTEKTLFGNAHVSGGFGGPIFTYSNTDGKSLWGFGGGGGVVLDHFFIGAFGMGETFDDALDYNNYDEHIGFGYGGLWTGVNWPTYEIVHLYTSVKIGGGAVGSYYYDDYHDYHDGWDDPVFVAIPEVGVELNVARWFRMAGTFGYRFVGDFNGWKTLDSNDLNAPIFGLTLRFGWFTR